MGTTTSPLLDARGPYPTGIVDGDATACMRFGCKRIELPVGISGEVVPGEGLHLAFTIDDPDADGGMRDILNTTLGADACKLLVALAGMYLAGGVASERVGA